MGPGLIALAPCCNYLQFSLKYNDVIRFFFATSSII